MSDLAVGSRGLSWAGCLNARDSGGLPTVDGGRIRARALIRADSLHWLDESGVAQLRSFGLAQILDLRSDDEAARAPSPFQVEPMYQRLPMIDPARVHERNPDVERSRADVYIGVLRRNGSRIVAGLGVIATAPEGPVLVHCHEGKDRTGIVVALALRLAGVEPAVLAEDYALSATCLRERYDADLAVLPEQADREQLRELQRTDPETMLRFLQVVDDEHGGVAGYLHQHGLDAQQQDRLRERLRSPC